MPEEIKPPKALRHPFRIVGGTDTPEAVAASELKLSIDRYLESENPGFDFNSTEAPFAEEVEVEVDGRPVTLFIEMSPPKEIKVDKGAFREPDTDRFDFNL